MTYDPIDQLKPVAPDNWIVDGPHIIFYGVPLATRMTMVRLRGGGLETH